MSRAAIGETTEASFLDKFGQMFTRRLITCQLRNSRQRWAIMAAIVFVVFAPLFWDRTEVATDDQS